MSYSSSLQELFNDSAGFEHRTSAVYGRLAKRFHKYSEIAQFWISMQDDELIHIQLLYDVSGYMTSRQLSSPTPKYIQDKAILVNQLLDHAETVPIENLHDAYLLAREIENSDLNDIFLFLVEDCVPFEYHKGLLWSYLGYHRANLKQFERRYTPAIRQAISIWDE